MNSKVPIVIFLAILVVAGGYVVTQNNSGSVQSEVDVSVSDVEVELERGSLFISIKNNNAIMTGPAEISFHGSIKI